MPGPEPANTRPAEGTTADRAVLAEEICRNEPLLIELQSLLAHGSAESVEALLMPPLIVHRLRLHMLKHDVDLLDSRAADPQAPGHARARLVRDQVQRWIHDGLLVTVRHQPLSAAQKPAAMARFFGLFNDRQRGCLITPSREAARQMLDPACWTGQRPAPLVVSVERSGFVALSTLASDDPQGRTAGNAARPATHPPRDQPPASPAVSPSPADRRGPPEPADRGNGQPPPIAEQRRWLDQLIDRGYVFVPDTSALMHSPRQTARRFFERELLPRLLSQPQNGSGGASSPGPSCMWVHRRVRGELMRLARSDGDQKLVAKATDGLKAVTMLADAGLVIDHDDAEGTRGSVDSYADPALELLLRKHQHQQCLCILTQDRGLAAKLLAQRDAEAPGRAEIVRLCVDGRAAIEGWDALLSSSERQQAAREVSVDARVEAQLMARPAPPAPQAPNSAPRRPPPLRAEVPARTLANGARITGTLKRWKDEQGYGFVQPDDGGPDLFLHIRTLPPGSRAPREGDRFTCLVGRDPQGRLRAERAWPEALEAPAARGPAARAQARAPSSRRPALPAAVLAALLGAALLGLAWWFVRR